MTGWLRGEARVCLASLPAATVIIDDERRVVVANAEALALLGVEEGGTVALPTRDSASEQARTDQRQVLGAGAEPFLASVAWRGVQLDGAPHTLVHVLPIRGAARARACSTSAISRCCGTAPRSRSSGSSSTIT